jgi:hypothetical protein
MSNLTVNPLGLLHQVVNDILHFEFGEVGGEGLLLDTILVPRYDVGVGLLTFPYNEW